MIKKFLIFLPVTFAVIILLILFLYWQTNIVSELIEDLVNLNIGESAQIDYGRLEGDILNTIHIEDLHVRLKDGSELWSNQAKIRYSLFATLSNRYQFDLIEFDSLHARFVSDSISAPVTADTTETELSNILENVITQLEAVFTQMPEISLDRLLVHQGRIQLSGDRITLDSISVDLNLKINHEEILFNVEELYGRWRERNFDLQNLRFQIIGRPDRITLNRFRLKTPASHAYATGELSLSENARIILSLEDIFIKDEDLNKLFDIPGLDSGYAQLSVVVVGTPSNFATQVNLSGQFNTYAIDTFTLDSDFEDGDIIIRSSRIRTQQSDLAISGRIARKNNRLRLSFSKFNIDHFVPDTFVSDLTGYLQLTMDRLNFRNITGAGELVLYNSAIDSFRFDSLRFAIQADNNTFRIVEPSFLKLGDNMRFTVKGQLDRENKIDFNLTTEDGSLETLARSLNLDTMGGNFDGNLFISGVVSDPNVECYLWFPQIRQGSTGMDSLMALIKIDQILSRRKGNGTIFASKGFFEDVQFNELRMDLRSDSNTVFVDTLLLTQESNYFSSKAIFNFFRDTLDVNIPFLRMFYRSYWIENDGPLLIQYTPEDLDIKHIVFKAPENGLIEIRGFYENATDIMQYGLQLSHINMEPFAQFLPENLELSGTVEGNFEIYNPHKSPELSISLSGQNIYLNQIPVGKIAASFDFVDRKLYVKEFTMREGDSRIDLDGGVAIQLASEDQKNVSLLEETFADMIISWQNFDLGKLIPALKLNTRLSGIVSGNLKISGSLKKPEALLEIFSYQIEYDKLTFDDITVFAHIREDSIVLDRAYTELNGTALTFSGWQNVDLDLTKNMPDFSKQPLVLKVESKDDQMEFLGYFLEQVEKINGTYESELWISGTPDKLSLTNGYFRLKDGSLELSRVKNPITNLNIEAIIENSQLKLNNFSGYSVKKKDFWEKSYAVLRRLFRLFRGKTISEGVISIDGTVNLSDIIHPVVNLEVDMNEFFVDYFVENTQLSLTSDNLKIFGRDSLFIEGKLDLPYGNYTPDLAKLQKNIYLTSTSVKKDRAMAWNLEISIPGNFFISSSPLDLTNNFQFEIMGELRSIQEPHRPAMELSGVTNIISGKYGSWGQDFQIKSGAINFTDPKMINPSIDIRAERQSRDYIFELLITGTLDKQQLDLQVKNLEGQYQAMSTFDKLTLLSLGTTAQRLSASDIASAGQDVINTSVETALSRGAESVTGLDRVELSMEDRFVDLQSLKLNNGLKDASVSFGKYLSSNLYLEYKSQLGGGLIPTPKLSWQPGNQIGLEYRINKSWSVDSYYSQTQRGNNMVQVSLSWKTTF